VDADLRWLLRKSYAVWRAYSVLTAKWKSTLGCCVLWCAHGRGIKIVTSGNPECGKAGVTVQYTAVAGNPFAVLTAIVAPAILTNASSVLALGTSNRLARVVDRTRVVAAELSAFEPESPDYQMWAAQLEPLGIRAQLLLRALRFFYAGLGLFAASALVSVGGSIATYYGQRLLFEAAAALAVLTGASAVVGLASGCVLMVRETQLAVRILAEEARIRARHHRAAQAPR
jgi:hypothetical protein